MNDSSVNDIGTSLPAGGPPAVPGPEPGAENARPSAASRGRMGILILRLVVLIGVVFATVGLLLVAETWLVYRAEHTVVSTAMVRGQVHKIGARIDGKVKAVEVQPGQHVSKGQVLIRLEDAYLRASLQEAQSA